MRRNVADRTDVRIARQQRLIHDDAILDGQVAGGSELDVRDHTDTDHDEFGGQNLTVDRLDARYAGRIADQMHHLRFEEELHSHFFVLARENGRHAPRYRASHGSVGNIEDRDADTQFRCRGCELEADETRADDDGVFYAG